MSVTNLFLKIQSGEPMLPVQEVKAVKHAGLVGNKYQGNLTPRQILITRLETLNRYNLKPGEIRENIVVSNFPVDELKSGQVIQIGEVQIRITFACEPCTFIETVQKGLLRKIEGERGALGIVYKSGVIKLGDDVEIIKNLEFPSVPYKIRDRFKWLVTQIPEGKVLSYKQIIETLGLWNSVYRALPAFIKALDPEEYPLHRIVNTAGELLPQVKNQESHLAKENIKVKNDTVDLAKYSWDTEGLYLREWLILA